MACALSPRNAWFQAFSQPDELPRCFSVIRARFCKTANEALLQNTSDVLLECQGETEADVRPASNVSLESADVMEL